MDEFMMDAIGDRPIVVQRGKHLLYRMKNAVQSFDPEPHASSVDLAFIDGAHTDDYVRNDTEKIARMMRPGGLVFWHDYGGKGRFRGVLRSRR